MNPELTDITLVVDRSGSMHEICDDAQGGVNAFISNQAREPGEALLTLVQFDTEYEFIHNGVPIAQAPNYELVPRGGTALLDAIGRAINETGERLRSIAEPNRPGLVIFVVMTDGQENSSREFTKPMIREMIEHQQHKYGWHFTFLGADQDAFAEASSLGMHAGSGATFSKDKVATAYSSTTAKVTRMRKQRRDGDQVVNQFTDQELSDMN
jgi:uncharacterized protein YegL